MHVRMAAGRREMVKKHMHRDHGDDEPRGLPVRIISEPFIITEVPARVAVDSMPSNPDRPPFEDRLIRLIPETPHPKQDFMVSVE